MILSLLKLILRKNRTDNEKKIKLKLSPNNQIADDLKYGDKKNNNEKKNR